MLVVRLRSDIGSCGAPKVGGSAQPPRQQLLLNPFSLRSDQVKIQWQYRCVVTTGRPVEAYKAQIG